MDKPCDHHKNCGDCFGPNFVRTLETTIENLTAFERDGAPRHEVGLGSG